MRILRVVIFGAVGRGFAQSDEWNLKGFYFITPTSHTAWQVNWCLVIVYYPAIAIDNMLGMGRPVGSEPIYHLSLGESARCCDVIRGTMHPIKTTLLRIDLF